MSIRVLLLDMCNRMFLLWCLGLFTASRGFLLNSTGGAHVQHIQDSHYLLLMDLLSVERQTQQELKQSLDQMENFVLKLQNQINSNSGEIAILKSQLTLCETKCENRIKNQTSGLKETVKQMNDSQGTISRKVNDLEGKLVTITNENTVIKQENIMILNKVTELNNRTLEVKESVDAFSHSETDLNCQNLTKVEESIKIVNQQIESLTSQYAYLVTSDNSRKQDVLALINETYDVHQKIDNLKTNISRHEPYLQQLGTNLMSCRLSAMSNKHKLSQIETDQTAIVQKLSNISSQMLIGQQQLKVVLTSTGPMSAPPNNYTRGSVIKLPLVLTHSEVTNLDNFKQTGTFTSTKSGVYLFSVYIMTLTFGADCEITKNDKPLFRLRFGLPSVNNLYYSASNTVALHMEPRETFAVKAFSPMTILGNYSSFTAMKIQ